MQPITAYIAQVKSTGNTMWGYSAMSINRTCTDAPWAFTYNVFTAGDSWQSSTPTKSVSVSDNSFLVTHADGWKCVITGVGADMAQAPVVEIFPDEPCYKLYNTTTGVSVTCN
jgi:hypothetical protein